MTDTHALLRAHTADLKGAALDHDPALQHLVATAHDYSATPADVEAAAIAFIHAWGANVIRARSARFGTILHTIVHRDDVSTHVAAWDRRMYKQGGLTGWYRDRHQPIDKTRLLDEYTRAVHGTNYAGLDDHHKATAWADVTAWHKRLTARREAVLAAQRTPAFEDVPLFEVPA